MSIPSFVNLHYWMAGIKSLDEWRPVIAMLAVDLTFAIVNILLKKVLDEGMNHLVLITYRLSICCIFLAPIGYFWERNTRPKITLSVLCSLFLSAIVGASLTQYLVLLGIQYTSATFACAFINIVPVVTFITALPFGLEALNIRSCSGIAKVFGTLICIGGTMLLILYKGMPLLNFSHSQAATRTVDQAITMSSSERAERWTIGCMVLMAGTLLWSSWFLIQYKIGKRFPCQYSSTAIMSFFGAIQSAVLCLSIDRDLSIWVPKGKFEILTVLYAGMIGSGLSYVGMSWCVKKRGPVFTASFSPLVQILAGLFDVPLLHEQLHLGSVLGSVTMIIGLYILLWGKKKDAIEIAKLPKPPLQLDIVKSQEPQLKIIMVEGDS